MFRAVQRGSASHNFSRRSSEGSNLHAGAYAGSGLNQNQLHRRASSSSSVEAALPTTLGDKGHSRHVGRFSFSSCAHSDDEDTYSDDSGLLLSSEYKPLAFGFINKASRSSGAPVKSNDKPPVLDEQKEEDSSLSDSEAPLQVYLQATGGRRSCGSLTTIVFEAQSSCEKHDLSLSSSDEELSVQLVTRKRFRSSGMCQTKPMLEATHTEEVDVSSEEDDAPLNAQVIANLVRRLRDPTDDVPLEAFQDIGWSDRRFKQELEPLRKICEYKEKKAAMVVSTTQASMNQQRAIDNAIRQAVVSLPPEKSILAKVAKLQDAKLRCITTRPRRNMEAGASSPGMDPRKTRRKQLSCSALPSIATIQRNSKSAKMSANHGHVKRMKESLILPTDTFTRREKKGRLSASFSQVEQMESSFLMSNSKRYSVVESTMAEAPTKAPRRQRARMNHSVSFSHVAEVDASEIVETQTELGGDHENDGSLAAEPEHTTRDSAKPRSRRQRPNKSCGSLYFSVVADEAASEVAESGDSTLKHKKEAGRKKRRSRARAGMNVSFSFLPDQKEGEINETDTLLPNDYLNSSCMQGSPTLSVDNQVQDSHKKHKRRQVDEQNSSLCALPVVAENIPVVPSKGKTAPQSDRRKRRSRNNNRSISFAEVQEEEHYELVEADVNQKVGEPGRSSQLAIPGSHYSLLGDTNSAGGNTTLSPLAPDAVGTGKRVSKAPKKRKQQMTRSRELSVSYLPDMEITEVTDIPPNVPPSPFKRTPRASLKGTPNGYLNNAECAIASDRTMEGSAVLDEEPRETAICPAAKRRKKRKSVNRSREFSVSLLPEELAGEITERAPELLTQELLPRVSKGGNDPNDLAHARRGSHGASRHNSNSALNHTTTTTQSCGVVAPEVDATFLEDNIDKGSRASGRHSSSCHPVSNGDIMKPTLPTQASKGGGRPTVRAGVSDYK